MKENRVGSRLGSRFSKVVIAAALAFAAVPMLVAGPVGAAPGAPVLTAPADAATVAANPVLSWNPASNAVKYEVQLGTSNTFGAGTVVFSQTTANTRATPPNDLQTGQYFWRVRGLDATNVAGSYSTVRSFTKTIADSPVAQGPADGAVLEYPSEPLVFSWAPLAGAKYYEIQFDDDANFTNPPTPIATDNTSYAPTNPPAFDTQLFWRVRGVSATNVATNFNEIQSYSMTWSTAPTLVYPPSTNATTIEEIVLDWDALPGAAQYQVQIDPDGDFNDPSVDANVSSTTYSPSTTLTNGSFFWRVRGLSTAQTPEPSPWSAVRTFTRAWPAANPASWPNGITGAPPGAHAQVQLLSPANGDFTRTEPTFVWSPQREAARYNIQIGTDVNFSPGTFSTCSTNRTIFTPYSECNPTENDPGAVRYWRVQGVDTVGNVLGVFSSVRSYLYDPSLVNLTSPADGATVETPILEWDPVPDIGQYRVTIDPQGAGCAPQTFNTYNTVYIPETLLSACNGDSTFDWHVQSIESDGQLSRVPSAADDFTFTISGSPPLGGDLDIITQDQQTPYRPPVLTWNAITDAETYVVYFSVKDASSFSAATDGTRRTVWAYTGNGGSSTWGPLLPPGDYDFFVRAFDPDDVLLDTSNIYSFSIDPLPITVLTAPDHCPNTLTCTTLDDTPTLDWDPVDGAGLYIVHLANDANFTDEFETWTTEYTTLSPRDSLPDSQAGQATFWFVQPCVDSGSCGPFDSSVFDQARAFRKASPPVQTISPTAGQVIADEVTFEWTDYLVTGQARPVPTTQEARHYVVQVSTTANFTNIIDTSPATDQTTYTAKTKQYPDGALYWRVQAFDQNSNPLTTSAAVQFTKLSAGPVLQLPANGAPTNGAPVLQWAPRTYANTYTVEVYKNPDQPLATGNRVANITTRFTAAVPLGSLPAGNYGWRVRSTDKGGNPGAWTASDNTGLRLFTVTGPTVNLLAPADGAVIETNPLLLQWTAAAGATRYRVEASTVANFTSTIETITTDMTSWAPGLISPAWPNSQIFWRVKTLDADGLVIATSAVRSFQKDSSTAGEFTAVAPFRVVDSRNTGGALGPGAERNITVTGLAGSDVPASGVSAVVLNVTVTGPTAPSFLTVWPANVARPTASNLNYVAGQTVPNLVTVGVDGSGRVRLYNNTGSTHFVIDIVGYYSGGTLPRADRYNSSTTPTRILDTRSTTRMADDVVRTVSVAGSGEVPNDATAVVMNVTAVAPNFGGFLTVYPAGGAAPTASNLNFTAGTIAVPNLVTVKLNGAGDIDLLASDGVNANFGSGRMDVILDVIGWYEAGDPAAGARLNPVTPSRIYDSRNDISGPVGNGVTRAIQVRGLGGVPSGTNAVAVVLNVTVTGSVEPGFLTVWPTGVPQPVASNLNYNAGQTVPNLVIVKIGSNGKINVFAHRSTHVIVDVVAWFND